MFDYPSINSLSMIETSVYQRAYEGNGKQHVARWQMVDPRIPLPPDLEEP